MAQLVLLLGDQLSHGLSALRAANRSVDVILMAEVHAEATYVRHHQKKIAFIFSAMRHFAAELRAFGWQVDYTELDDPDNSGSLVGEVQRGRTRHGLSSVLMTHAGEWRVQEGLAVWATEQGATLSVLEDDRFLCSRDAFARWAEGRKQLRMEYFYRQMRSQSGLL
ncbi:MAG: cryptochrome/photolyase family protein, partial [Pseudomonadota bacterium]